MDNDKFNKTSEVICKLYHDNKSVREIADTLKIPIYLVEAMLIKRCDLSFR